MPSRQIAAHQVINTAMDTFIYKQLNEAYIFNNDCIDNNSVNLVKLIFEIIET